MKTRPPNEQASGGCISLVLLAAVNRLFIDFLCSSNPVFQLHWPVDGQKILGQAGSVFSIKEFLGQYLFRQFKYAGAFLRQSIMIT